MSSLVSEIAYNVGLAVKDNIDAKIAAINPAAQDANTLIHIQETLDTINHNVSSFARENSTPSPAFKTELGVAKQTAAQIAPINQNCGMDANTGKLITGFAHINQSIADIIKTLTPTRCMNRAYGCNLRKYQDFPSTAFYLLKRYAAIADAISKHEPRIDLVRITPFRADDDQSNREIKLFFHVEWTLKKDYLWIARAEYNNAVNAETVYKSKIKEAA